MKRTILRASGEVERDKEVGDGFETWNENIGATIGTVVRTYDGELELWCDDNGLCVEHPIVNLNASMLAGTTIVGDVIVFEKGDIT